jgi:hypothetical protein
MPDGIWLDKFFFTRGQKISVEPFPEPSAPQRRAKGFHASTRSRQLQGDLGSQFLKRLTKGQALLCRR